jgi:hypothetical protein
MAVRARRRNTCATSIGDVIHLAGDRRVRVTALVSIERLGEFVERPVYGLLDVETA